MIDAEICRAKKNQLRAPEPQFYLPLNIAFSLCLLSHLVAAAYAPLQDCDEVFNYWEPLHYLNHGYGLQTWEYSPEFTIRSWSYILIHAIPAKVGSLFARSKTFEFYLLRVLLAICCAATETRLFSAISRTLNPRIGIVYLMVVAFSPGIFYASVAFLPSSFAMYTSTLGLAAFMDWRGGPKTAPGVMWFGIGAFVGWPFAGILITPFVAEEIVISIITGDTWETFRRFLDGTVRSLIALVRNRPKVAHYAYTNRRCNVQSTRFFITRSSSCHGSSSSTTCSAGKVEARTFSVPSLGTTTPEIYFSILTSGSF